MNSISILLVAATAGTALLVGSTASARPVCGAGEACVGRVSPVQRVANASSTSPYAVPLTALGGRTLAEYLADHNAHRINPPW